MSENFDIYNIKAFGFGEDTNFQVLQYQTDAVVDEGGWAVYFFHTVSAGEPFEAVCTSKATLDSFCETLYYKYNGNVWFGSFQDVSIYAKQLKDVKIIQTNKTGNTMIFTVQTTLDTEIYNIPMSMKMYIPSSSKSAYALVNGTKQETEIHNDKNGKYIYVLDVPTNNSTVEICFS